MAELHNLRIDDETGELVRRFHIDISEVARKALREEIERRRREELAEALRRARAVLANIPDLEIVRAV
jgi:post-segregation antitoxin (ccd killing protein)